MGRKSLQHADTEALARLDSVQSRIAERGSKAFNLWIFDSPKNAQRLYIAGDLCFYFCVLLEGDLSVSRYQVRSEPYELKIEGRQISVGPDIEVFRVGGKKEWWDLTTSKSSKSRAEALKDHMLAAAAISDAEYVRKTEKDLIGKNVAYDNWLLLTSAINRARDYPNYMEAKAIRKYMERNGNATLNKLLQEEGIDPALMIAAVASLLQSGKLSANLEQKLFCENTVLTWSAK